MAYTTVQDLLVNKPKPECVEKSQPLKKALQLMLRNGYSQLPVVDASQKPIGLLSESTAMMAMIQFGSSVDNLLVSHAMLDEFQQLEFDEDVTFAAGLVKENSAVLIVQEGKLIGILTTHDLAEFFRQRAVKLMLVEQIEGSIRDYIRAAYNSNEDSITQKLTATKSWGSKATPDRLFGAICKYVSATGGAQVQRHDEALTEAFKVLGLETSSPKKFGDLTLNEYITLFFEETVWQKYASVFAPLQKQDVRPMLEKIRDIRNVLAHFKRDLDDEEQTTLKFCADFFARHEPTEQWPGTDLAYNVAEEPVSTTTAPSESGQHTAVAGDKAVLSETATLEVSFTPELGNTDVVDGNKYAPLIRYLLERDAAEERVPLTFDQIEKIIHAPLPNSARTMRAWWANDTVGHSHSKDWLEAGWRVNGVNISQQFATFQRTDGRTRAYVDFFSKLRQNLSSETNLPLSADQIRGTNWNTLISQVPIQPRGPSIAIYAASFSYRSRFRIEMYLDTGDQETNKEIFDRLQAQKTEIEAIVEMPLSWERRDNGKGCRIAAYVDGSILDDEAQHEALIAQCVKVLPKLYEALNERLIRAARAYFKQLD
jgi:CBS domain-containing protein